MVEVYDSHEQSERVKGWLRENGGAIVMGLVLAFGGLFGFKQWQVWQDSKAQQASAEYETMLELLQEDRLDDAVANFEVLKSEFPDSSYRALAALHMAAARVESSQVSVAIQLLEDALPVAEPPPVRVIILERLARLHLDQGDTDAALRAIADAGNATGFESRFEELRGDVHRVKGDLAAALEAYERALATNDSGVGYRPLLEMKIESLGGSPDAAMAVDGEERS
jgi:predicted negative regulator of RcsB-dependent stress response